jgi:hypothetical protein
MIVSTSELPMLNGGCLCGQVRYQITGPRRDIINCHCRNCRRTHGHVSAYTSVNKRDLQLTSQQGLKWYHDLSPDTYRGFCRECGASLFWDARDGNNKMAVSAGTLDAGQGLKTIGHVYVSEAGDYYEISDDLPQFERSNAGELENF